MTNVQTLNQRNVKRWCDNVAILKGNASHFYLMLRRLIVLFPVVCWFLLFQIFQWLYRSSECDRGWPELWEHCRQQHFRILHGRSGRVSLTFLHTQHNTNNHSQVVRQSQPDGIVLVCQGNLPNQQKSRRKMHLQTSTRLRQLPYLGHPARLRIWRAGDSCTHFGLELASFSL